MRSLGYIVQVFIAAALSQNVAGRDNIEIINAGATMTYAPTSVDAGPAVADILNLHYFPGLNFYNGGRYKEAEQHFTYLIQRPDYVAENPKRAEFMSISYYLRGMIYFHHSSGSGRYNLAKDDFQAALKWNPRNLIAYLELSRLYSGLGFNEQAVTILKHLLTLMPDEGILEEAGKELDSISKKTP
jgi:tetratricopeptide (TPR) repeat protein